MNHEDHIRGCQGREYTCTCGHDERVSAALCEQRDEIVKLQKQRDQAQDDRSIFHRKWQETKAERAEVDAAIKDAERWRWLSQNPTWLGWDSDATAEFLDVQVDAAIAASKEGK